MTSTVAPGSVYEVYNMCRYFQQTFYFNSNFRFLQWWLSQMLTPGSSKRSCFLYQGRSTILTIRNTYTRSGQLDKIWQPHFRRHLRQERCLNLSRQMYSSNSAHCLRECRQHFLFSTLGTTTHWVIH